MIDLLPLIPHAAGEESKTRAMREGTRVSTRADKCWAVKRALRSSFNV